MFNKIKQFFSNPQNDHVRQEITKLSNELARVRAMADDELRGLIVDLKFDTMLSIAELRHEIAELRKSGQLSKRSKTTQEFILGYLIDKGDSPNPSDILKH